jgi:hypothetical protein
MTRNRFFLAFAAALAAVAERLAAQTLVSRHQLAAPGTGRVWVNYNDQLRHARIENAELVEDGADLIFRPITGAAPSWRTEQRIATSDGEVFQLADEPVPGSLLVARNGLIQWEQDEYTVAGQSVTMSHVLAGERVILRYQVATPVL